MSWSTSTPKVVKSQIPEELENLNFGLLEEPALDQIAAAKRAALELLKSVPGPLVSITLSGHANGVGFQAKDGYANDFISIAIYQQIA